MDQLHVAGDSLKRLTDPHAFAGAAAMGTAFYCGPDAGLHLAFARGMAAAARGRASATLVNDVLLARFLGEEASTVRADLCHYVMGFRHRAGGLPPRLPRLWQI